MSLYILCAIDQYNQLNIIIRDFSNLFPRYPMKEKVCTILEKSLLSEKYA